MSSNKYTNLLNNTKIFAIGNIITKLAQYIIIVLCTYKLSTAEYGLADTSVQTVAVLVPLFSFDIADGLFRFSMDSNYSKNHIISSTTFINIIGSLIALVFIPIELFIFKSLKLALYTTALTIIELFQISIKEYVRGIGKSKLYMLGGFVNAVAQITLSVLLVGFLDLGILGYMITIGVSYTIELFFYSMHVDYMKRIRVCYLEKEITIELLKYSIPLAPNKIMWWIISASDRYFVLWMLGASATGLYAVAAKFPAILTIITGFFFQAWQMSAIGEYGNEGFDQFYSKIFDLLWSLMGVMTALLLVIIKYLVGFLVSDAYYNAWSYAPFLLVAAYYGSLQSFFGVNYTIEKNSIGTLKSTCAGAIVNLILNYLLIKWIGIQGATIATMISYMVVTGYRYFDTKNVVFIKSRTPVLMFATSGCLILEAILITLIPDAYLVISVAGVILILVFTKSYIIDIYYFIKTKLQRGMNIC